MVGQASGAAEATTVTVIEANIDDASPQLIGYAVERMLEAGALDTLVIPAQMKKDRPGVLLQVIAEHEKREELIAILLRETTTLGVRFHTAERRVQARRMGGSQHAHTASYASKTATTASRPNTKTRGKSRTHPASR